MYYDLAQDKLVQIPKQGERRERELQELVKKGKRPVALFVDEAHGLNGPLPSASSVRWKWLPVSDSGRRSETAQ